MFDVYPVSLVALGFGAVIGVGSILVLVNDLLEQLFTWWRR